MNIDLSGKTALVTGAGSGIGAACARELAGSGAFVWVNDLDPVLAQQVAAEIGGKAAVGDVASPSEWVRPVAESGPLHILVHNAGYDVATPLWEGNRPVFDRLLAVQLGGPFQLTSLLLPSLRAAQGACVIYISSIQALVSSPEMSAYTAAKGGLLGMVKSQCQELGPSLVRVLSVSPGYIDTALMETWLKSTPDPNATRKRAEAHHPMGRMGEAEDVAGLVAFLASNRAQFINGTNIIIDGGLTSKLLE